MSMSNVYKHRKSHKTIVDINQPGFEYVISTHDRCKLKCKECGNILERATSTIRYKRVECKICKEKKIIDNKIIKTLLLEEELKKPKICKLCGTVFYSEYPNALFCSDNCRAKSKRQRRSYRKRCRKYGTLYDPSVTRKKVLERDNYTCKICGKTCNENDKRWGSLGPDFPTVDHIIPLAAGGSHVWENVQCVCAICNSYKRDLLPEPIEWLGVM